MNIEDIKSTPKHLKFKIMNKDKVLRVEMKFETRNILYSLFVYNLFAKFYFKWASITADPAMTMREIAEYFRVLLNE